MNPTAQDMKDAYSAMIDVKVPTSTSALTDQELTDVFNGALEVAETVDPIKGTPTVKY